MFNLTRDERKVIIFLLAVSFLGLGINLLMKLNTPVKILSCYGGNIGKIELNSCDGPLLKSLPGIGDKLARRIIEYRREAGGFREIEELKNIEGMTDYRYEKIKNEFILKR